MLVHPASLGYGWILEGEPDGMSSECKSDDVMALMNRDEYLPLTYFDKIYVVDLCQPLLDVARERCRQKGWNHVEFLCQDASQFVIPEWESGQLDPRGSLSAITMSYSLSMVCTVRSVIFIC